MAAMLFSACMYLSYAILDEDSGPAILIGLLILTTWVFCLIASVLGFWDYASKRTKKILPTIAMSISVGIFVLSTGVIFFNN